MNPMDANTKAIYKRGALFVVPAFVFACLYVGARLWIATRTPKLDLVLDRDAMVGDIIAYCDQVGWDAGPCAQAVVVDR